MRQHYALPLLILVMGSGCGLATAAEVDESKVPPLQFVVRVGERLLTVTEGEESQLDGMFTNPRISITPKPLRTFPYQGITFKYPRSFTFEADIADPTNKTWTLTGNDLKIVYVVLKAPLTTGGLANNMVEKFGRDKCKVADATTTLGRIKLTGTRIQVTLATRKLLVEIYSIPSRKHVTKLLVFQDTVNDVGDRSNEGKLALRELDSSFAIER